MNNFFKFIRSIIVSVVVGCIIYVVLGALGLAIFGDRTQLPPIVGLIIWLIIVIVGIMI